MRVFPTQLIPAHRSTLVVDPIGVAPQAAPIATPEVPLPSPPRRLGPGGHLASMGACFGHPKKAVATVLAGALLMATPLPQGLSMVQAREARSAEEIELRTKIGRLVNGDHGGDLNAAFQAYDQNGDRALSSRELKSLLTAARVGNPLTRGMWVDGIIKKMDSLPNAKRNKKVDWRELQTLLGQ